MHVVATPWTRATFREEAVVSAYEAKTHLSGLLERASQGETITITKHGNPVAKLVPIDGDKRSVAEVVDRLRGIRKRNKPLGPDLTIRELLDEGKRYP